MTRATKTEALLLAGEPVHQDLIDALDHHGTVELVRMVRSQNQDGIGWHNTGAMLRVDRSSPAALEADAGREALSALRQLFRLGLGHLANDGLSTTMAPLPQTQEQLAAGLVQLQGVVDSLVLQIGQMKLVLEEMQSAHSASHGQKTIVAQGGAA